MITRGIMKRSIVLFFLSLKIGIKETSDAAMSRTVGRIRLNEPSENAKSAISGPEKPQATG